MKISDITFSDSEISLLAEYRDNQKDGRLKIRFIAMIMLAAGICIDNTALAVGFTVRTVLNWYKVYSTKGADQLNTFNYKQKKSYLNSHQINQVVIYVTWDNPDNIDEVVEYIKNKFSIAYCNESVRLLLLKHGLKLIRPDTVPGSPPSAEDQKQFIQQYNEVKNTPNTKVLFGDAMHLHHQNIPGACWGDPKFMPSLETNSGRKRLNILGAYDLDNHMLTHVTGEENCNADRVIECLEKILKNYTAFSSVYLIVDNARYFHAVKVREWLKEHPEMNLMFLPPYAPNLNLIERYWRFAKKNLVRNKYYKQYRTFRAKVFQFLNSTTDYIDELSSLLVEKFEIVYA